MIENNIKLNYLGNINNPRFIVKPLKARRVWMDNTPEKYAYRCLPLQIANQYGWGVYGPSGFTAEWEGDNGYKGVKIVHDENHPIGSSQFGSGILTIHVDFIITTNKNVSIFAQGIPNFFTDKIVPLSGIIETDWLPFTFTFNYKFTRPGKVRFEKDDPLFSFFPIQRGYIESFSTSCANIADDKEFNEDYLVYRESRSKHLRDNVHGDQKYYKKTFLPNKEFSVSDHSTKIDIKDFYLPPNINDKKIETPQVLDTFREVCPGQLLDECSSKEEEAPKVTIVAQYPMPPVPAITDCSSPYGDLWHYGRKE